MDCKGEFAMKSDDIISKASSLRDKSEDSLGYKMLYELFDKGTMETLNPFFKYNEIASGVICAFGTVNGRPAYAFAQSEDINGAAMSKSQALKLSKLYDMAFKSGYPIIGIFDSKGAILKEGNELLESYGDIIKKCSRLSGVVPQISVVNGMCFGAMASIACCSDIIIMSKSAKMGIEISGENSSVDSCVNEGVVHLVAEDGSEALTYAKKLVTILPSNNLCECPILDFDDNITNKNINLKDDNPYKYIENICDKGSFAELQKGYGVNFITGLALINGKVVGIVSSNEERLNEAEYDSCSKVAGFVMFCNSYSIPIITLINAKKITSLKGASKLACAYSNSTTLKIALITGEVYGTAYTVLCSKGVQDMVFSFEDAVISTLNPQTAVEILWKEELKGDGIDFKTRRNDLVNKYKKEMASSLRSCQDGIVDDIISFDNAKEKLNFALEMLSNKRQMNLPKKNANIKI